MGLTRPRYSSIQDTDYKQSVRVATTEDVGNLLATGNMTNTIDDIEVIVNDRILVKDQGDQKQNGIYFVINAGTGSNGTWRRSLDADANFKVTSGMTTTVVEGSVNVNKTFKLTTLDPITIGTSNLTFVNPFIISTSAGGANTQVQFNDVGSALGGSSGLTFNKTSNLLAVGGNVTASYFLGDGSQLSGIDTTTIKNSTNSFVMTHSNGNVTVKGNLVPSANLTYDLGSPTQRWATGYFAGTTLDLGGETIKVNPSTGTWEFSSAGATVSLGKNTEFDPPNINTSGNVNVGQDLIVGGSLYIAGNTTTFSTNNVVFNDALVYLANGNPTDFLDIGTIGNFTRSSLFQHTGLVRDATDGVWKLFEGVEPVPTTTIDFGSASYSTALIGNLVTRSNITVGGNLRLGGALLTSAGLGGDPGQFLTSTGTNLAWVDLVVSTNSISDGTTGVVAEGGIVNVAISGSNIVLVNDRGINVAGNVFTGGTVTASNVFVTGNVTAQYLLGSGQFLTGLPAGYSNVNAATFLASGTLTTAIDTAGNVSATNLVGAITSSQVTTALGFTPYNSTNPSGYISAVPNASTQVSSLGVGIAASGTTGEIRASNNITAYYSSDARLKENVRDIPNALDKVAAIGGKLFDWTDEYIADHGGPDDYFLRKEDFGVIAQDVQSVFPLAVRQRPDDTLAVDYEKLCALAFQAIVELKAEIDILKSK
jgi:hypothetical protein